MHDSILQSTQRLATWQMLGAKNPHNRPYSTAEYKGKNQLTVTSQIH